jgi:hypothetical protein
MRLSYRFNPAAACAALALPVMLAGTPCLASGSDPTADTDSGEVHELPFHRNAVAIFGGITDEDRRERASTIGFEYERRLSERFGVGALVEHAFGDLDFTIYAVPFAYHSGRWRWYVAPGIEDPDHSSETEFLVRVGVEYFFDVGDYHIGPQFDVDFVDGEEVLVLGVMLARGF